jgi:short-subunit dehydrogenase
MSTILIAGASKGIGLEIARRLEQDGHRVYGTSRNPESVEVDGVRLFRLDVTDDSSVQACVQQVTQAVGGVDVLINNVGYDLYGAAEETSMDELFAQMDANFLGAVRLTQAVLPHMRRQRSGKIINMSSLGGRVSLPFNSAYSASKAALGAYSEALRYELLPWNIFVSLIEPGQVRTNTLNTSIRSVRQPLGLFEGDSAGRAREAGRRAALSPEAVAQAVAQVVSAPRPRLRYLVGGQARMVTIMRQMLPERLFEDFIMRQFVQPTLSGQR